jgi:hypothetical protein
MDRNKKSIENSVNEIFDKAAIREKAGRGSFETGWKATLEIKDKENVESQF